MPEGQMRGGGTLTGYRRPCPLIPLPRTSPRRGEETSGTGSLIITRRVGGGVHNFEVIRLMKSGMN